MTMDRIDEIISESIRYVLNESSFDGSKVFVSYLKKKFHPKDVTGIRIQDFSDVPYFDKCRGGLWACPVDTVYGWDDFCRGQEFSRGGNKFYFRLRPEAKIYAINNEDDYLRVATKKCYGGVNCYIDFEKLLRKGYDGIYVSSEAIAQCGDSMYGFMKHGHAHGLDGWDVESICIFNPDVIFPISSEDVGEYSGGFREGMW